MSINPNTSKILQLQEVQLVEKKGITQVFTKNYKTGELLLKGRVINGKLNGIAQVFYKNGNVHCNLIYKDNELHGICKGYYLHGALALEILFNMGKAIHGFYYKKNGFKTLMSRRQLDKKSDNNL